MTVAPRATLPSVCNDGINWFGKQQWLFRCLFFFKALLVIAAPVDVLICVCVFDMFQGDVGTGDDVLE